MERVVPKSGAWPDTETVHSTHNTVTLLYSVRVFCTKLFGMHDEHEMMNSWLINVDCFILYIWYEILQEKSSDFV